MGARMKGYIGAVLGCLLFWIGAIWILGLKWTLLAMLTCSLLVFLVGLVGMKPLRQLNFDKK